MLEKDNELAVLETTNIVLEKFGYKKRMTRKECLELYGKKWWEYFEYLLPDKKQGIWMKLQRECVEIGLNDLEIIARNIRISDFAKEVLERIGEKHEQILISNSNPKSMDMFLKVVGLETYFKGGENVFAVNAHQIDKMRNKKEVLDEFLEGKMFEQVITIGDSPSDMELGNVRYLYTHPGKKHREAEADYKIHDLRDVLREL